MLKVTSRYGTERIFRKLTDNLIEFISHETLYYTGSGNDMNDLDSVDPDGGPLLHKGYKIKLDTEEYEITKFTNINYDKEKEHLEVLLHVKKI